MTDESASDLGDANGDRQQRAREYAAIQRRFTLFDLTFGLIFLAVVQFSGLSVALRNAVPQPVELGVLVFTGVLALIYGILTLPVSYYSGFVLPKRYGLLVQSFGAWLADQLKGLALIGVFGVILVEVLIKLLAATPYWWLALALVMLLLTVVIANLAPILIVPLFYKLTPLQDETLVRRLTALAEQAGAKVKGVYVMDMSKKSTGANAALMGLGSTRRIVLSDTMLAYPPDEIEVVLAHELAHHVHRDIPKGILLQTVVTIVGLWIVDRVLIASTGALGLAGPSDLAALPLVALVLSIFGLVSQPITNGYSRIIERAADVYALETTKNPTAFIKMMTKLHDQNLSEADPPAWVRIFFYDHPPYRDRVALARG